MYYTDTEVGTEIAPKILSATPHSKSYIRPGRMYNAYPTFQCGGVTKEHYKQMVQLDESDIGKHTRFSKTTPLCLHVYRRV